MIPRRIYKEIKDSLGFFPIVAIIGPRQVGKTTLAKQIISKSGSRQFILIRTSLRSF